MCYLTVGNDTLMLNRNKDKEDRHYGRMVPLGGHYWENESPEKCAVRESLEESGLKIEELRLKGIVTYDNSLRVFGNGRMYPGFQVSVFTASKYSGNLENPDEGELLWVPNDDILKNKIPMWPSDEIIFEKSQGKHFFTAEVKVREFDLEHCKVITYFPGQVPLVERFPKAR